MSIALDEEVAENIKVWLKEDDLIQQVEQKRKGLFRGFGLRRRKRGGA